MLLVAVQIQHLLTSQQQDFLTYPQWLFWEKARIHLHGTLTDMSEKATQQPGASEFHAWLLNISKDLCANVQEDKDSKRNSVVCTLVNSLCK